MTPHRFAPLLYVLATLTLAVALCGPATAQLVLLGSVEVQSKHGEPLRATIGAVDGGTDASALESVELLPRSGYEQLGFDWDPVLATARIAIGRRPDGRAEVRVTTDAPVTADNLTLVLDVRSRGGRYQRGFQLKAADRGADPRLALPATAPDQGAVAEPSASPAPSWASPAPSVAAPARTDAAPPPAAPPPTTAAPSPAVPDVTAPALVAPTPEAAPTPTAVAPMPDPAPPDPAVPAAERAAATTAAPAPSPPAAAAAPAQPSAAAPPARLPDGFIERRTVAPGATLVDVARAVRPRGTTLEQTMVALFGSNPTAFEDGDPRRLRSGAALDVPDPLLIGAYEPDEARRTVRQEWRMTGLDRRAPSAEAPADRGSPSTTARGPAAAPAPPRSRTRAADQLVLAPPTGGSGAARRARAAQAQTAFDAAMREATSRIEELEKNVSGLKTLIALTEQRERALRDELARLRAAASPPPLASADASAGRTATDAPSRAALAGVAPPPAVPETSAWAWLGEWVWIGAALAAVLALALLWVVRARRTRRAAAARDFDDDDGLLSDFGPTR
jgi:pilus assembly protein FimV